jgi:thiamine-phosphate pyrophosphorylase
MTDERIGDRLWDAIECLPEGGGIVFRHYSLSAKARLELGQRVAELARARRLLLAVGRSGVLAEALGARLVHNPATPGALPFSLSVHDEGQARVARERGAELVFVSPVFPTRSHTGAPSLGIREACRLADIAGRPAIALGGMNLSRFRPIDAAFHGFAGIDCWLED